MLFWANKAVREPDGKAVKEGDKTITHGLIAFRALNADFPDEKVEPSVKYERYKLANRLQGPKADQDPVSLSVEEAALIKKLVGIAFPPAIMGQVWDAIEDTAPAQKPEKAKA